MHSLFGKNIDNFSKDIKFDIFRQKLHYDPILDEVYNTFLIKVEALDSTIKVELCSSFE